MRMSLFLNSTMSKSCVHETKSWAHQDKKSCRSMFFQDNRRTLSHQASSSKQSSPMSPQTSRLRQLPDMLSACYELQWFLHSRTSLSQTLDAAIKQIHSLSALLLLYLTLLLLSAQVAGLMLLLSCAVSLPLGFQLMIAAVFVISAIAFKTMY